MRASPKLRVERMEDRLTPAQFGLPWLDPNVTVSFAPDGTNTQGVSSALFAKLCADGLSPAQWQAEIKWAFQTWAVASNLNFGFVGDSGDEIGTTGRVQGDTRFGDIRIAARPLGDGVLAITTPPGYTSETLAGDIVLNSNYQFAINPAAGSGRYDLYTVFLQEVGHALGVGNSTDPSSVMYETYQSTRTGLYSSDLSCAKSLYGKRQSDAFEGTSGNGSLSAASILPTFTGTTTLYARGDVTKSSDVDVYSFTTPSQLPNGTTVRLTTKGVSLLAAKIELVSSSGYVLATSGTPSSEGDLELSSTTLSPNTTYFIRVTAPSGTSYRVGAYDLRVIFDPNAPDPGTKAAPTVDTDAGTNNTVGTATVLSPQEGTTAQRFYDTYARIDSWSDVDVYKITAPKLAADSTTTLHILLASYTAGKNYGDYAPKVTVYDRSGNVVATDELTYYSYRRTYQLRNVPSGETYYLAVSRSSWVSDADYRLTAFFRSAAVNFDVQENLDFSLTQTTAYRTLSVTTPQVFAFWTGVESGNLSLVTVDIYDANQTLVKSWTDYAITANGASLLLTPGEYTIRVRVMYSSWVTDAARVTLRLGTLTDPIGLAAPSDPTTDPTTNQTMDTTSTSSLLLFTYDPCYYAWLM
jgi:hypothetical protein